MAEDAFTVDDQISSQSRADMAEDTGQCFTLLLTLMTCLLNISHQLATRNSKPLNASTHQLSHQQCPSRKALVRPRPTPSVRRPTLARIRLTSAAPPMTPGEREIVKSYGDWTSFCQAYGLKPWNSEENEEAIAILKGLAAHEANALK